MGKKTFNRLLWLFLFIFFINACGDKSAQPATPSATVIGNGAIDIQNENEFDADNGVQVIVRFAVTDSELSNYLSLIQVFEEDHPDIKIELVSTSEILDLNIGDSRPEDADLRVAQAADVFGGVNASGPNRLSITRDLTPFIQADNRFSFDDFYLTSIDLQEPDGTIRLLPISINSRLIIYNKEMFDSAGLPYPEPGWTWNEFRAIAEALTLRENSKVVQWGFVDPFLQPHHLIEGMIETPLINFGTEPPTIRFTDEDIVDAVRWYTDWFSSDGISPYLPVSSDAYSLIAQEQTAMWLGFSTSWRGEDNGLGLAPLPVSVNSKTTPLLIDGLSISAGSAHPEEAWQWIKFLSAQEPIDRGRNQPLPARISVAEVTSFWTAIPPQLAETLNYALENGFVPQVTSAHTIFNDTIHTILRDNNPIEQALANAEISAISRVSNFSGSSEPFTVVTTEENVDPESTPIIFVPHTVRNAELKIYRDLAEQFVTDNLNVQVEILPPDSRKGIGFDLSVTANNSHCFQLPHPFFEASLEEPTPVKNLSPFVEIDTSFDLDDFYSVLINQYTVQGQLWGIPAELQPLLIVYNKTLFDAENIAYPSSDWSVDEFLDAAVALTEGEGANKQFGFVPDFFEEPILRELMNRLGAVWIDDSVAPPTMNFTHPATVEAMRWYANLTLEHGVKPVFIADPADFSDYATQAEERLRLIQRGRAAMWTLYGPTSFNIREWDDLEIGLATLPSGSTQVGVTNLFSTGYFISSSTSQEEAQACWEWIKFLSESATLTFWVPARRSVAESLAYRQHVGTEYSSANLASIANIEATNVSASFYNIAWMRMSSHWLGRAYSQIVKEQSDVEEAMEFAQQTFDAYRACVIDNDEFTNYDKQSQCALEVDPSLTVVLSINN